MTDLRYRLVLLHQCDRCGRSTEPEWLTFDGLGMVCPTCRAGAQTDGYNSLRPPSSGLIAERIFGGVS